MNLTFRGNRIYNLVIEDHPDSQYDDLPAVDPRGVKETDMLEKLGNSLFEIGINGGYWSNNARLYIGNICIGLGEMSNISLPLISYISGLAEFYHKETETKKITIMDVINPPVVGMAEISEIISNNFPFCEQPYTIPFVIYDDVTPDFKGSIPPKTMRECHILGDEYFGVGATTLILPIDTSQPPSSSTKH